MVSWWQNLKTGSRIVAGLGLVTLLSALVAGVSPYYLHSVGQWNLL